MDRKPVPIGTVDALAKQLLLAKADEGDQLNPFGRAVFLVGAGASVSAGIPSGTQLAGRLAQRLALKLKYVRGAIDEANPLAHAEAFAALKLNGDISPGYEDLSKAYGELFGKLSAIQQREFIREIIRKTNKRQINWTHLAIGELVRQRIVHTLLTTNFDDLLLDGLARCDLLPAILDGVESLNRLDPSPPVPQLVYLHGSQHTYSPRNSTAAVAGTSQVAAAHGGLFSVLQKCSLLVVVGYAGNPGEGVMELLLSVGKDLPELTIFWISHGQHDTLSEKAHDLLAHGNNKWLIPGQDADLFFSNVLKKSGIGVPEWFNKPVEHLIGLANRIKVASNPTSAALLEEVMDFKSRLGELLPKWQETGIDVAEQRELRQLLFRNEHAEIWRRLKDRDDLDNNMLEMRADSACALGSVGLEPSLPQAVKDYEALLKRLVRRAKKRADVNNKLGSTLLYQAQHGDGQALSRAIGAYKNALKVYTKQDTLEAWASVKRNQGTAYLILHGQGHKPALSVAIDAFREVLKSVTPEALPVTWAATKTGLGNALLVKGELGDEAALLESIAAHRDALTIYGQVRSPDWASAKNNLGNALLLVGEKGDQTALHEAFAVYNEAVEVHSRIRSPHHWATITNNLGKIYLAWGKRGDAAALDASIFCFSSALDVRKRQDMPHKWAETTKNYGNALVELGRSNPSKLSEAAGAFHGALEVVTDANYPLLYQACVAGLNKISEIKASSA